MEDLKMQYFVPEYFFQFIYFCNSKKTMEKNADEEFLFFPFSFYVYNKLIFDEKVTTSLDGFFILFSHF